MVSQHAGKSGRAQQPPIEEPDADQGTGLTLHAGTNGEQSATNTGENKVHRKNWMQHKKYIGCMYAFIQACMYLHTHVCMYICMFSGHVCMCVCMCMYACMYVCMYVCIIQQCFWGMYISMHVSGCACMCVCVCMYVCMHVCVSVHVCTACMYVWM